MTWHDELLHGVEHISKNDARLSYVIEHSPAPTFRPHTDYYRELVESIISQQLSVKAASTIAKRFVDLFEHFPTPEEILVKDFDELKSVGLSRPKTNYIRDLASHIIDGSVTFDHFDTLTNDEITTELTKVKGIGEWTTHMFLMFCMGRFNVLPVGDLGIKTGIMKLYGLDNLPTHEDITGIAKENTWPPYESIACWYVWKSIE